MKLIIFILSVLLVSNLVAQTFTPGWYIMKEGGKYIDFYPETPFDIIIDDSDFTESEWSEGLTWEESADELIFDIEQSTIHAGEVIYALELLPDGLVHCVDIYSNHFVIDSESSLMPVKQSSSAGVVVIWEGITIASGIELRINSVYWMVSQNLIDGTITIQLEEEEITIPEEKVFLYSAKLKIQTKKLNIEEFNTAN